MKQFFQTLKKPTIVLGIIGILCIIVAFFSDSGFASCIIIGVLFLAVAALIQFLGQRKTPTSRSTNTTSPAPNKDSLSHIDVKLAGVTFDNEDGTPRQSILRKIRFNDPPFDARPQLTSEKYDYNGELAIAIKANGVQIGNIPRDVVALIGNKFLIDSLMTIKVYGGQDGKSFGATVDVWYT